MSKICTTIEQSKHLLKLGLNPESADMRYEHTIHEREDLQTPMYGFNISSMKYYEDIENITYLPAWSLSALLEVMPSRINDTYKLSLIKDDVTNGYYYNYTDRKERRLRTSFASYNPFDAAFEMMCWLLENKKV